MKWLGGWALGVIVVGCGTGSGARDEAGGTEAAVTTDASDTTAADSTSGADASTGDDADPDDTGTPVGCPSGPPGAEAFAPTPPGTLLADPMGELPQTLAEVGLYPDAPDLFVVADAVRRYTPAWPLWSNGSDKHRFLALPAGGVIDTTDPDRWVFPAGTILLKTFAYDDGVDGCARPVETRLLRKTPDGTWDYAAYGWDAEGITATRLDLAEPVPIEVTGDDGPFTHHVPARIECRACHESGLGEALGVQRLQLSIPRVDGGMPQIAELADEGLLSSPVLPVLVDDSDPVTRDVLGMFVGNCVHCHNGSGGPSSSFDLRPDAALANTIDHPTESSASASGIRIVPGEPEQSILFLAFSGETKDPEVSTMPPMGVDVRDGAAIENLRTFILGLHR